MDDLYAFLRELKNYAYEEKEILLSYALDGWIKSKPSSTTEGMADLELILIQYKTTKNNVVNEQIIECLSFLDDWFKKWNGRQGHS